MTKARTLADFISDGSPLADGTISVSEVSGAAPLANPTFTGTASGTFSGPLTGAVTGDLTGNVTGDLTGNVTGNVTGDLTGNVTAPFVSLVGTLPTLDFSTMLLQVAVSQATDPVAVGTWFDSTASDGYKYGDLDKSGSIGAQDGLLMNQLSAGLASEAVTSRWYNILVPSLVTQSWYADLVADGTILAGGTLDITNGWTIEQEAGNFHISKDNVTKLDIASDGIDVTGGVKADKFTNDEALPTVRPSLLLDFANSKTLDPRITFTRGSTATYWDGHTTAKAEENLVLGSDDLGVINGSWALSNLTRTAAAIAAPDGTTTAAELNINTATNTFHFIGATGTGQPSLAGTVTFSVYCKANDVDYAYLCVRTDSGTNRRAVVYHLSGSGSIPSTLNQGSPTGAAETITSVGNGWYRCTLTLTNTSGTVLPFVGPHDDATLNDINGSYAGTSGQGIYAWGAQLEYRDSATAYTATTSQAIVKYQPTLQTASSGEARFDHDPVTGESKGLLIEEARTNLANWSQIASNFFSGNLSDQMYDNAGIAPDGTHTADLVHESTLNEHQSIYGLIGGISGSTAYTRSCYFKSRGSRYIALMQYDGFTNHATTYDLQDGAVVSTQGSATGTIEDVGNGWFRCSQTYTTTAGASAERIQIGIPTGANAAIQQVGDGWSGVLFWGWQLEQGSFPTSYIPTSGSTVTRSTDVFNMPLSGIYSSGPVTMYYEAAEFDVADYSRLVLLSDGTNNNRMQIAVNDSLGDVQSYTVTNSNIEGLAELSYDAVPYQYYKTAAAFAAGDNAVSAAGLTPATATPTSLPQVTNMYLGSLQGADADKGGWFKKVALYPSRLSNATLQAMTEE